MTDKTPRQKYHRELGRAIRNNPESFEVKKKHGSFWVLQLQSGIIFLHDDYNTHVVAFYPNKMIGEAHYNFGMIFNDNRDLPPSQTMPSELHYLSTIELINTERCIPQEAWDIEDAWEVIRRWW